VELKTACISADEETVMVKCGFRRRVQEEMRRWAWTIAGCVLLCVRAQAGAWGDDPAHGQLIMTTSLFRAWGQYGAKGQRSPFANAGRFQQFQFGDYLELGMSKRWTLVLNAPFSNLQYSDSFNQQESGGLGDLEIGVRRRFNRLRSPWAVSGQFTATVPGYKATVDPALGNHQEDVEGRLLVGRGTNWGERHWFWDGEAAYRYRTGAPADQVRGDFTAGVDVTKRLLLLGQFYSIKGLRNGAPLTAKSNPNAQSDFDLYKAQGSLVVRVWHKTGVQLGWGHTLAGRNTGRGGVYVLGLWQSF
jgi:protein XagA